MRKGTLTLYRMQRRESSGQIYPSAPQDAEENRFGTDTSNAGYKV